MVSHLIVQLSQNIYKSTLCHTVTNALVAAGLKVDHSSQLLEYFRDLRKIRLKSALQELIKFINLLDNMYQYLLANYSPGTHNIHTSPP